MSHKIIVPMSQLQPLFGECYPDLPTITSTLKINLIRDLVQSDISKSVNVTDLYSDGVSFEIGNFTSDVLEDYNNANKVERWLEDISSSKTYPVIMFWDKIWKSLPRSDMFCTNNIQPTELFSWIRSNNLLPREYQLFSKFGSDRSIAFSNQQQAIMFKMCFSERV